MTSSHHHQFPVLFSKLISESPCIVKGQTANYKENASSQKITKTVCIYVVKKVTKQGRKGIGRKHEKKVMITSFSFLETKCD
jgi:hypothetical protein